MDNTHNTANAKLELSMGILNIVLGAVLFADGIVIALFAFVCLLFSFSLFFLAAIPAFLFTGMLCIVTFITALVNAITGIGAVVSSRTSGKVSKLFTIATMVVDTIVIPANIVALVCGSYLLYTEVDYLSVLIFVIAVLAILLAVASLILSIVRIVKRNKQQRNNNEDAIAKNS